MPAVDDIPVELWTHIISLLVRRRDLAHVSQTSRAFNAISVPLLYQTIWYKNSKEICQFAWMRSHDIPRAIKPLSLTVRVSEILCDADHAMPTSQQMQHQPGSVTFYGGTSSVQNTRHYVVSSLYQKMVASIFLFGTLQELVFQNAMLPHCFYDMIHNLPRLERLHIEGCVTPRTHPVYTAGFNPASLSITELTLRDYQGHGQDMLLRLATAHNLRTLRVDKTANVFQFCKDSLPAGLKNVYILAPMNVEAASYFNVSTSLLNWFWSFLTTSAHRIQWLSIAVPLVEPIPSRSLPLLRHYRGHVDSLNAIERCGQLESLVIEHKRPFNSTSSDLLREIAHYQPGLRTLTIRLTEWDVEVIYAVTQLFPDLRKLKVTFRMGYLSEDFVRGMGPRHLFRLPYLNTLEIFPVTISDRQKWITFADRYSDCPMDDDADLEGWDERVSRGYTPMNDRDTNTLMLVWKKSCPSLREVQLDPGFVWRRNDPADEWCKRIYEWVNGRREFL